MRLPRYYVMRVGEHWEVSHSQRASYATTHHPDRGTALEAAQAHADAQWRQQRVASEVMLNEDDGAWHRVAAFGSLLDF